MKKDSLVIDGKNFISSRRASEIAVYSKDYVGQLCREGRLVCRRVNRLWWVDEDSIRKHAAETMKSNHTSFRSADDMALANQIFSRPVSVHQSKTAANAVIGQGIAAGIPMGMAKKNIPHLALGGIVTEPTLAVIGEAGPEAVVPLSGEGFRAAVESMVTDKNLHGRPVMYALFPRRIFAVGFVLAIVLVLGTALVSISVWNGSKNPSTESSLANAYSSAPQGQNFLASVWDGIFNSVASILVQHSLSGLGLGQNGSSKIVSLNNSSGNANNGPTESAADLSSPRAGLVVVPSQGSSTDAKLAQTITNSFSDNVTVTPGSDGTTGVIKPEFRTVAGHDFLYVLVPVKTASTTTTQ